MSRYFVFVVGGLSFLLVAISGTTVSVAFPVITSTFDVSLILAGWVLSVNQLAATAIMPLAGKAGDIFGGKRTFLISIAVFTTGSLLCAIAPNIWFLITARFIQAIGAGSFLPIATAIVSDQFPNSRQQAIGLFSSIMPIGMIIGPNIGGWLVHAFGWRSIFWLNIPLGIIVFMVTLFLLKPGKKGEGGHLDMAGAGLFSGMLSALLIALSEIGNKREGLTLALSLLLFAAAIILAFFFFRHESKAKDPIIDLQVLKEKPFLAANIFNLLYGMAVLGVMSFVPLLATSVFGMSTLASGVILTPRSIGTMAASIVTSLFLPKWGYRGPMLFGAGLVAVSLVLLGFASPDMVIFGNRIDSTTLLVIIMFISGAGMGVTAPAANNACIELMPDRVATITGVRGMFRQTGSAISIALTSLILQNFSNIGSGFRVVFYSLAGVLILAIPFIFAMPKSACVLPSSQQTGKQAT